MNLGVAKNERLVKSSKWMAGKQTNKQKTSDNPLLYTEGATEDGIGALVDVSAVHG